VKGRELINEIATEPGTVPDWVEVVPTGVWLGHPAGDEVVTPGHLAAALAAFERQHLGRGPGLVIDWHHGSIMPGGQGPTAPAAGWISAMELREDGTRLWGKVMWTPRAASAIEQREYRGLSPVLRFNRPDPETGEPVLMQIHSVALTNTPFMTELESLNEDRAGASGAGHDASPDGKERPMKLLECLANALGLKPEEAASKLSLDAGAEDKVVAEALVANAARLTVLEGEAAKARPPVTGAVANAIGVAPDADEAAVIAAVAGLKTAPEPAEDMGLIANELGLDGEASTAKVLVAIRQAKAGRQMDEAEQLVANAVAAGKIPPKLRDRYVAMVRKDLPAGRELVNSMGVIGKPQVDVAAGAGAGAGGDQLTDAQANVARMLGLSKEAMLAALSN